MIVECVDCAASVKDGGSEKFGVRRHLSGSVIVRKAKGAMITFHRPHPLHSRTRRRTKGSLLPSPSSSGATVSQAVSLHPSYDRSFDRPRAQIRPTSLARGGEASRGRPGIVAASDGRQSPGRRAGGASADVIWHLHSITHLKEKGVISSSDDFAARNAN